MISADFSVKPAGAATGNSFQIHGNEKRLLLLQQPLCHNGVSLFSIRFTPSGILSGFCVIPLSFGIHFTRLFRIVNTQFLIFFLIFRVLHIKIILKMYTFLEERP
ncbi:hypothetical protein BRYFOR_06655 [Marvinbryantia formatexigens DSM 14469]|uniref:Uncharacterized protein n=1 Tax=Marvinbryantia formatexigens DSM 14469 TaxID=478749 RepID=C6LCZ7_9FIRM|nr:hypothetical protein BRYFOR_06655 [Marvinbryantia formatexigens DSM 14469]